MAALQYSIVVVAAAALIFCLEINYGSCAMIMKISPSDHFDATTETVEISCRPDISDNKTRNGLLFGLVRNEVESIALLREDSHLSFGTSTQTELKVSGRLDSKDLLHSFLNVTFVYPKKQDDGVYTCVLYYLDVNSDVEKDEDTKFLLWDKPNLSKLEEVVGKLMRKVAYLEKKVDGASDEADPATLLERVVREEAKAVNQSHQLEEVASGHSDVIDRIGDILSGVQNQTEQTKSADAVKFMSLMEKTKKTNGKVDEYIRLFLKVTSSKNESAELINKLAELSAEIYLLEKKGSPDASDIGVAFTATSIANRSAETGSSVHSWRVVINQGQGFDKESGVFAAPRPGLYVFSLGISQDRRVPGDRTSIFIKAGNQVLATIDDFRSNEQASVSTVTELKAGDTVKIGFNVLPTSTPSDTTDTNLYFNGFLVHNA